MPFHNPLYYSLTAGFAGHEQIIADGCTSVGGIEAPFGEIQFLVISAPVHHSVTIEGHRYAES